MDERINNQLLDSVPDGVFTVDTAWRITSFNRAAEQITGVRRAEALGRPCCEVFRASICESACALKQTLATRRPVANKVVYIVNAQGERIPISISTAVLRDARRPDRGRRGELSRFAAGERTAPRGGTTRFVLEHHRPQRGHAAAV